MRWTARRKAELVERVRAGTPTTLQKAIEAHGISPEEWESWCRAYDAQGATGLRIKSLQGANNVRSS